MNARSLLTALIHPIEEPKPVRASCVKSGLIWGAIAFLLAFASAFAQPPADSAPVTVTTTVTALGPGYQTAFLTQNDVIASSGKTPLKITGWVRAQGSAATLQLAILIDNNVKSVLVGQPLQDLANFIRSQPPTVSIGIFFAEKGKATEAAAFTTDRQASASSLSQPTAPGVSLRVYPSLPDLTAHWPSPAAARREIVMIGSGYDALIGGMEDPNMNAGQSVYTGTNYDPNVAGERDPYLNSLLQSVEHTGIEMHAIYVPDPRFAQMVQANIMRDRLIQFANQTGGLGFFNGASVDSFAGYLREINNSLLSQYLLTFTTEGSRKSKGELRPLHVEADQSDVTLYAPQQVFIPGS